MGPTVRVTVLVPGPLRDAAGGASRLDLEVVAPATLGAVLDQVGARLPALERRLRDERQGLRRHVNFYLDGEECRALDGARTVLSDGAEVQVIPSVAGG